MPPAAPFAEMARPLNVGIAGAGVMGRDIAQAIASKGHHVVLLDVNEEILADAIAHIKKNLRGSALRGLLGDQGPVSSILARITTATTYAALNNSDFVVENVVERWDAKQSTYHSLGAVLNGDVIIAANTSTFPITELSALITSPERVVGIHFMNPATSKTVVEVIPGDVTSPSTLQSAQAFLNAIGKRGIVVKDAPGFVSNRVLMLTINEAIHVVEAGTACPDDVDNIFIGCFGHAMGPLATADLIGLDTIQLSLESLRDRFGDEKFEPAALLKAMIAQGRLGRKSGHGFYSYSF